MSDLSITLEALERSRSQLPVSSYFDEDLFRREHELLFRNGPRYVGHALAVPEVGDYHALPQEGEGRALVRTPRGVELVSNVCRHRQAVMLRGRGNTAPATSSARCTAGPTTCTAGWSARRTSTDDPCLNLRNYPLQHLERPAVRGQRPRRRRRPGAARRCAPSSTSAATCSTACTCTSATTTGRPSSRSTSRTTTSARSTPASASSSPATTCAGRWARELLGADRGRATAASARQGRLAGLPAVARRGAEVPAAASRRSTARSG